MHHLVALEGDEQVLAPGLSPLEHPAVQQRGAELEPALRARRPDLLPAEGARHRAGEPVQAVALGQRRTSTSSRRSRVRPLPRSCRTRALPGTRAQLAARRQVAAHVAHHGRGGAPSRQRHSHVVARAAYRRRVAKPQRRTRRRPPGRPGARPARRPRSIAGGSRRRAARPRRLAPRPCPRRPRRAHRDDPQGHPDRPLTPALSASNSPDARKLRQLCVYLDCYSRSGRRP